MNQVVVLVAFVMINIVVEDAKGEAKPDPSTLQALLNEQYYLGSGADRSRNAQYTYNQNKEIEFTEEENKIVQDVYSPDYYEPNIILDFRYLKTGGRGYARSDGGQILILPKRDQMPNLYNDYDTLIEFYRLKNLQDTSKHWKMDELNNESESYKSINAWAPYKK